MTIKELRYFLKEHPSPSDDAEVVIIDAHYVVTEDGSYDLELFKIAIGAMTYAEVVDGDAARLMLHTVQANILMDHADEMHMKICDDCRAERDAEQATNHSEHLSDLKITPKGISRTKKKK